MVRYSTVIMTPSLTPPPPSPSLPSPLPSPLPPAPTVPLSELSHLCRCGVLLPRGACRGKKAQTTERGKRKEGVEVGEGGGIQLTGAAGNPKSRGMVLTSARTKVGPASRSQWTPYVFVALFSLGCPPPLPCLPLPSLLSPPSSL